MSWISRANFFTNLSKGNWLIGADISTGLIYTKTIIHIRVGEKWYIFTSPFRGSVDIHYYPPPLWPIDCHVIQIITHLIPQIKFEIFKRCTYPLKQECNANYFFAIFLAKI